VGWFAVTGGPLHAAATLGPQSSTSTAEQAHPGTAITVELFLPLDQVTPVPDYVVVRIVVVIALLTIAVAVATYFLWPLPYKAYRRGRRRRWARRAGPIEQVAVAYAEFRDLAVDLGDQNGSEPPMHFIDRVMPDEEHTEFAWLVTRALWGDLPAGRSVAADAEMMSRSLRRRLSRGQPRAIRVTAALSRASLRDPYWPDIERAAPSSGRPAVSPAVATP
jgi:hypothetical protein